MSAEESDGFSGLEEGKNKILLNLFVRVDDFAVGIGGIVTADNNIKNTVIGIKFCQGFIIKTELRGLFILCQFRKVRIEKNDADRPEAKGIPCPILQVLEAGEIVLKGFNGIAPVLVIAG